MTTMSVVGECFFWYWLTRVVPDKFHRAVKWLCCVYVCSCVHNWIAVPDTGCRSWQLTSVAEVHVTIPLAFHIDLLLKRAFHPSMSTTSAQYLRNITSARASALTWTTPGWPVRHWSCSISLVVEFIARMITSLSSAVHLLASSPKLVSRSAISRRSVEHQSLVCSFAFHSDEMTVSDVAAIDIRFWCVDSQPGSLLINISFCF